MNAPKKIWVVIEPSGQLIAGYTDYRSKLKYIRADLVDGLVEELKKAAYVFRVYQAHHEAKGDMTKAEANKSYAEAMEAAAEIGRGME